MPKPTFTRKELFMIFSCFIISVLAIAFMSLLPNAFNELKMYVRIIASLMIVLIVITTNMHLYFARMEELTEKKLQERKDLREEIRNVSEKERPSIQFDINLGHINEFLIRHNAEAKQTFIISVVWTLVGIGLLITITMSHIISPLDMTVAAVAAIGSLLTQIIGGVGFYMYNKNREQSKMYFDQLSRMQDTKLAIDLANIIEQQPQQTGEQYKLIIESLLNRNEAEGKEDKK